ncbi:MAG: response regulator [Mariprofundales bacterium]|nr:response regulator [Mariprofundales bacterium]
MKSSIVLLVDDDTAFCSLLAQSMQNREFDTMEAHSADEAMGLIDQIQFTHAVLDLNLGSGDSGLCVLRYISTAQPLCQSLILTGFASIATAVEATKSGAAQYLLKPATVNEILAAFNHHTVAYDPVVPDHPPSPKRLEWEYIQRTLLKNRGNISATAKELGMHRRTLQRKLAKHPPNR